jgi:hypothetical protein
MAFGPSCEFAPLVPARITFHSRWLSRGSASPQHMRRARSPKSAQPSRRSLAAPVRRRCRIEFRPWGLGPLRRFAPERASRKEAKPSAALTRFSLRSLPSSGSVPVSRPLPSCGSLVAFHAPAAGPLQGLVPRMKFREVLDRPVGAPLGLPFKASSPPWLTVSFPGPSSSTLCVLPPCGLQHPAPWSLAQRRLVANRFRPPAFMGFSTSGFST